MRARTNACSEPRAICYAAAVHHVERPHHSRGCSAVGNESVPETARTRCAQPGATVATGANSGDADNLANDTAPALE